MNLHHIQRIPPENLKHIPVSQTEPISRHIQSIAKDHIRPCTNFVTAERSFNENSICNTCSAWLDGGFKPERRLIEFPYLHMLWGSYHSIDTLKTFDACNIQIGWDLLQTQLDSSSNPISYYFRFITEAVG